VDDAVGYFRDIANTRDRLPFWIDGVVMKINDIGKQNELGVVSGKPKGQVAWKFDSVGAETVIEGVVITGGHNGVLYPTAQLRPVEIGGTTVSNASLATFDEIARLDVAIGDKVWVVKANDIIPKIIRVTERAITRQPILTPTICPFCAGEVGRRIGVGGDEGIFIECRNADCSNKSSGKIRRWIASLDIQGIGDVVLEALLDRFSIEDAADLYGMADRAEALAKLIINVENQTVLGAKRTKTILDAIESLRDLTLSQFLGSLGIDRLGKRRVELMAVAADGALDTLDNWRSGKLRQESLAEKAGVPKVATQIQDAIDAMAPLIDKLLAAGVKVQSRQQGQFASRAETVKTVCISGKLPSGMKKSDYEAPLRAVGYELVDAVSKELNYLVLADPDSISSKAEKARKLGVLVISEDQLQSIVNA
jgi:DNA ligase (NAD+)